MVKTLHRKKRTMKRMRGGYSSNMNPAQSSATFSSSPNAVGAANYVESNYGNTNQQYNNVFDNSSKTLGNTFSTLPASQQPSPASLNLIQSAGRRRKKMKKGGLGIGAVAATAAVPLGLLYLQNKYGKKSRKTRRRSRTFKKKGGGTRSSGGNKKRKHITRSHKKKGGMFSQILSNAIVPFGLLATQNKYGKKSKKNRR